MDILPRHKCERPRMNRLRGWDRKPLQMSVVASAAHAKPSISRWKESRIKSFVANMMKTPLFCRMCFSCWQKHYKYKWILKSSRKRCLKDTPTATPWLCRVEVYGWDLSTIRTTLTPEGDWETHVENSWGSQRSRKKVSKAGIYWQTSILGRESSPTLQNVGSSRTKT